jgi:hypothetical protein
VQNAKDTFYEVLRSRVVAGNPERTIVLRGLIRPGVLVEENELITATTLPDCFRLRWTETSVDRAHQLPLAVMRCEVFYETAGQVGNGGMDRGRALAAMDAELAEAIGATPQSASKQNYAGLATSGVAAPMSSRIWWTDVNFGAAEIKGDRVGRSATVMVMSYEEAGE